MNIFQQYGIKEVADVTFYSINRIGDEEFYTPVLYLDTLKISTIEKKNQSSDSYGGYGNQKLSSWNFSKNITLKLEDALFSPASMSLLWGGQLNAKFSKYTSAIVKINMANKYGKLNYSIKAYPSPKLTAEEWEVIFQACNDLNKTFIYKWDYISMKYVPIQFQKDADSNESYVEENRMLLQKSYYSRDFTNIFNKNIRFIGTFTPNIDSTWYHSIVQDNIAIPDSIVQQILSNIKKLQDFGTIQTSIYDVNVIDRMEKCTVKDKEGLFISTTEQKKNLLKYYLNDKSSSYIIYYDPKTMLPLLSIDEEGEINGWEDTDSNSDASSQLNLGFDFTKITEQLDKGQWIVSLATFNELQQQAKASTKLNFIKAIANIMNVELLWGYDNNGLIRVVKDGNSSEQSDFKDNVKIIHHSSDKKEKISNEFEPGQSFPEKTQQFKLRIGTPYLKWSRTVKNTNNNIGHTFIINSDTFPDQYKIVGETYIRNRKGKDERYQFIIPRAQIATDTNITLQAEGDPTVFSMNIDVFTPPNDIMMELRQYDVTEDNLNGGMRITPQKNEITTTQTIYEIEQMESIENNEIY